MKLTPEDIKEKRDLAEQSLEYFIRLVHPYRLLGSVHLDVISWWARRDAKSHDLLLLPRDHQKSALMAYRVAWEITKNPAIRVLYISSTANLATKQLKFIKDILSSTIYRTYWPEMVNKEEGKREKWTEGEISVDHPKRKLENVRDPTVFTAGLTTSIVGLHCDIAVLDDVVVADNAYDEPGRQKVKDQAGYLSSIAGTDSRTWVCGTRYHPRDLYQDFIDSNHDIYDELGEVIDSTNLYDVFERQVEVNGEFLWPRMQSPMNGKWFGFDWNVLSKKKASYFDQAKFRAQYYNDPNDNDSATIKRDSFQYYNKSLLRQIDGRWYFRESRLNIFSAIDFAYTTGIKSDFTCIVVIGVDTNNNIYILDIMRFKTNRISDMFDCLLKLHIKWDFRKVRAEVTAAQSMIIEDLKNNYLRPHGLALSIDEVRPTKKKEERIEAILQPRYSNLQIWHYKGGNCELLEEELVLQRPSHDDIKDALSHACEIAVPPSFMGLKSSFNFNKNTKGEFFHPRFGGVS